MKTKIAVLVSGGGTNLQALIDAEKAGSLKSGELALVIADNNDAYALQRAAAAGIKTAVLTKKACGGRDGFEKAAADMLRENNIELIILAGFLYVFSASFTSLYPHRIINVHPSLIPSFCGDGFYGLRVHEEALKYGVKVTGATVHFVNEITDGGEIIAQKAVYIQPGDTPEILQQRVMREAEWVLLPAAAEEISQRIAEEKNDI